MKRDKMKSLFASKTHEELILGHHQFHLFEKLFKPLPIENFKFPNSSSRLLFKIVYYLSFYLCM